MSGFGDSLRHARGNKGVTLTEAEKEIRIPRKYLRALEDEDFSALPDGVYARGIVRNYAQYLHLDPDDAILYFDEVRGGVSAGFKVVPAVRPMEVPSHWAPNFALIAFVVVISAVIFAWLYSAFFATSDTVLPTPTPSQPTPTPVDVSAAILALTPTAQRQASSTANTPSTATAAPPIPSAPPAAPPSVAPTVAQQPAATQAQQVPVSVATAPVATATGVTHAVTVQALEDAWVTVTVDGVIAFNGEMAAEETRDFSGQSITIESGRATSIYLFVDGGEYGYMSEGSAQAAITIP